MPLASDQFPSDHLSPNQPPPPSGHLSLPSNQLPLASDQFPSGQLSPNQPPPPSGQLSSNQFPSGQLSSPSSQLSPNQPPLPSGQSPPPHGQPSPPSDQLSPNQFPPASNQSPSPHGQLSLPPNQSPPPSGQLSLPPGQLPSDQLSPNQPPSPSNQFPLASNQLSPPSGQFPLNQPPAPPNQLPSGESLMSDNPFDLLLIPSNLPDSFSYVEDYSFIDQAYNRVSIQSDQRNDIDNPSVANQPLTLPHLASGSSMNDGIQFSSYRLPIDLFENQVSSVTHSIPYNRNPKERFLQALGQFCNAYDHLVWESENYKKELLNQPDNSLSQVFSEIQTIKEHADHLKLILSSHTRTDNEGERTPVNSPSEETDIAKDNEKYMNEVLGPDRFAPRELHCNLCTAEQDNKDYLDRLIATRSQIGTVIIPEIANREIKIQEAIKKKLLSMIESKGRTDCHLYSL